MEDYIRIVTFFILNIVYIFLLIKLSAGRCFRYEYKKKIIIIIVMPKPNLPF